MITNEDILHFVWKTRQFNQNNLTTTNQETIRIISPGWHNHDQGPDFINAKIAIGNTIWAGQLRLRQMCALFLGIRFEAHVELGAHLTQILKFQKLHHPKQIIESL